MAMTACIPNLAKGDFLSGVHTSGDTYKVALYTQAAASFGTTSTVYTVTGEIVTTTYVAGGATLATYTASVSGTVGYLDWSVDPTWGPVTITSDGAVIYNSSKSSKLIAVLTYTSAASTAGTWTLVLPAAGATAIITMA